ncbi:MAG: ribonuclease R, partial [Ignavibacteriae bacterium]|nr:ribonuclease R [Ignavibacteriota bacterium]
MDIDRRQSGELRHQLIDVVRQKKVIKSGKWYYVNIQKIEVEKKQGNEILTVTGRFEKNKYFGYVVPDSKLIKNDIYISKKNYLDAKEGEKVVCELINYDPEENKKEPEGRIIEVLGKAGNVSTEIFAIARKYNLEKHFPEDVNNEANNLAKGWENKIEIDEVSLSADSRKDIREKICFTIDPEDAKDYDDAVSIEKTESGGYLLGVHIADVSFFVKENSPLDVEALKRGTSVYLLNNVIPMLPEALSNEICSLKPKKDRYTFSVEIELSKNYSVKSYKVYKSLINSKRRFSYDEVQDIIDKKQGDFKKELVLMDKIAKCFYKKRMKEGGIDFESREVKFDYNEEGKITGIKVKERLDSMKMIEEFMLLANKCVTEFVTGLSKKFKEELPFVYRIHEEPDVEKLNNLSEFVSQFGYRLHIDDKESIKELLESIKGKPEEYLINDLLIRSMAKAIYDEKNIGHYGLGFEDYTHFTSPIRRYPDLIVHRILKEYLQFAEHKNVNFKKINIYKKRLPEICKQSSAREQNAVHAEREIIKLKQIEYMSNHIGDEFLGIISGMVHYGMFVEIIEMAVEGLVRFKDIEGDYYEFLDK